MSLIPESIHGQSSDLISAGEAAHILGFKQTSPIMNYVKRGYLTAYQSTKNNRKYFRSEEILDLPKPLPIPPPAEKFKGHGRSEQDR
jgi:hypothetical protein